MIAFLMSFLCSIGTGYSIGIGISGKPNKKIAFKRCINGVFWWQAWMALQLFYMCVIIGTLSSNFLIKELAPTNINEILVYKAISIVLEVFVIETFLFCGYVILKRRDSIKGMIDHKIWKYTESEKDIIKQYRVERINKNLVKYSGKKKVKLENKKQRILDSDGTVDFW